jgi:hypothetical protein
MTVPPLTINSTPEQIRRARSSRRWRAISRTTVHAHPICHLRLPGCTVRSTTADHIIPASLRPDLFFEPSNTKGACRNCNDLRRNVPMSELAKLRDPKYDRARKATIPYARRRIASHRRPSHAATTFFTA